MSRKQIVGLFLSSALTTGALIAGQPSAVQGTVRGPDGKPLPAADVRLETVPPQAQALLTKTDNAGKYHFANLNAGLYKLTVLSGSKVLGFIEGVRVIGTRKIDFEIKPGVAGKPGKAKHLVWVPASTGSHIGGQWVEVDESEKLPAETENVEHVKAEAIRDLQSRQTRPSGF